MPADQETIRYTPVSTARTSTENHSCRVKCSAAVPAGGYYADGNDAIHIVPDSRNQPAEFTETRFPLLVEKLALRTDSAARDCGAADRAMKNITAPWSIAAPSSPPTGCGWAVTD